MTFAHSFYSEPLYKKKFSSFEISLGNTLLDYAYSVACIHKNGHIINLYADKKGIELLKNIPYDNVYEIEIPENEYHFAAQCKFHALKKMKTNEILIDGDLFLENSNIYRVLKNSKQDVLYSFFESHEYVGTLGEKNDTHYFQRLIENFNKCVNKNKLTYEVPLYEELEYPNTSLIRFKNSEMKNKFVDNYFKNKELIKNEEFEDTWPDLILEQYFLNELINEGYTSKPIIANYPNITKYEKELGFTHLGETKTKMMSTVRMKLYFLDKVLMSKVLHQYREIIGKDL